MFNTDSESDKYGQISPVQNIKNRKTNETNKLKTENIQHIKSPKHLRSQSNWTACAGHAG